MHASVHLIRSWEKRTYYYFTYPSVEYKVVKMKLKGNEEV